MSPTLGSHDRDDRPDGDGPDHPDEAAALHERADGAHADQLQDEANLREDDTAPGVDPDEVE
jgi:hypothetical protein